jgi:hypothetical protein
MDRELNQQEIYQEKPSEKTSPATTYKSDGNEMPLDQIIHEHGYSEGRLFRYRDKATFTFMYSDELHNLHFDGLRKSFFYQGHKLEHLDQNKDMVDFLIRFKKNLFLNGADQEFMLKFDAVLSHLGSYGEEVQNLSHMSTVAPEPA